MKLEEILPRMRKGTKYTRPVLKPNYVTILPVEVSPNTGKYKDSVLLISPSLGILDLNYYFTVADSMSSEWTECEPIIPAKMFADSYKVRCPNCLKLHTLGSTWENKVGNLCYCSCGHKLLLTPPKEFENKPESKSTGYEWPKA